MHRGGIRFGNTPRPGMGSTSSEPSVPQKPLACQSAKFGINVQSLRRTCWLYPRSTPAPARAYATGLGDFAPQRPARFVDERGATESAFRAADCLRYLALGGDIGDVSIPARIVGCPQSFRNRLGLSHYERPNGRAVLLYDFRLSDFARAVAQV